MKSNASVQAGLEINEGILRIDRLKLGMADSSEPSATCPTLPIPVDLFLSNKLPDQFTNSSGDTIYRLSPKSSSGNTRLLLDASGNPLISIIPHHKNSWQGFKGDGDGDGKDLLFTVSRTASKLTKTEFNAFLSSENSDDSTSCLKIIGWPFQRSCTIYKGDTIIAQTSLMHKLRELCARRGRFRLTIFPGAVDPALVVALVVIFLDR